MEFYAELFPMNQGMLQVMNSPGVMQIRDSLDKAKLIPYDEITFVKELSRGHFGIVYEGH